MYTSQFPNQSMEQQMTELSRKARRNGRISIRAFIILCIVLPACIVGLIICINILSHLK